MKKIYDIFLGAFLWCNAALVCASEKFEVLPDLPEALATAQAASISKTDSLADSSVTHSIGQEPNLLSVFLSLVFVILLIYATGIIYTKLNKMGLNAFKKQMGDAQTSKVSVVSTTALGGNKTLHIVELDGKRMLLGASSTSIQLLKDLGSYPPQEIESTEFSKIEIPNIRIPKIEIPKIEFPNIGFTKAFSNLKQDVKTENSANDAKSADTDEDIEISDVYEEGPDGIIDKLFQTESVAETEPTEKHEDGHKVDPDEYALYKKYL